MEDQNTDLNFDQVREDYRDKFGALPPILMMMSMETYYRLLDKAIKRGIPVNDKDYEEAQPLRDKHGNRLVY